MKEEDYDRLSKKDKQKIDKLLKKAKKVPRKKEFTKDWLYCYLNESYKDWSYDNLHEMLDMLELFVDVAVWINHNPRTDLIYILNDHFCEEDLERATKYEIIRFNKLIKKWNIKDKDIPKLIKKERMRRR